MKRLIPALVLMGSFSLLSTTTAASQATGLYTYAQWDPACASCWPTPRDASTNHCTPKDCIVQGYYHCKMQNPPLAIDDDPRLQGLIKSGACQYVSKSKMNAGELAYVNNMHACTFTLDKMAGRFVLPAKSSDVSRMKVDFYLNTFKATVLGSAESQLKLAIDYDIGMGTSQDRVKATRLYEQAAKKGVLFAQYAMAARYAYGIATPKDTEKALYWLKEALQNNPNTLADKNAKKIVEPCAINLIGRLTPS